MAARHRIWIIGPVVAVFAAWLIVAILRFLDEDDCLDRGGSYRPDRSCNFDPRDTVNNGPWPRR